MQLLHTIETWVLEEACRQAALWPEHIVIAVNVSPSLVVYTEIAATVAGILSASGLPAARLELEVTKSAILDNDGQTLRKLGELKSLGVSLAMDDFGTGYSSLSYLSRFPFDRIKIDRAFVKGLLEDSGSAMIVRATTEMAQSLGLRTTAEGVETPLQSKMLQELGIEFGQGYLFSKPMPVDELPLLFLRGIVADSSRAMEASGSEPQFRIATLDAMRPLLHRQREGGRIGSQGRRLYCVRAPRSLANVRQQPPQLWHADRRVQAARRERARRNQGSSGPVPGNGA